MHIDHLKLIELLSEASGIEKDEVEKQLVQLSEEIEQAIKEGDAYEVEGFGIFSGIGKNLIFIPSDELSTEINYKYVGMQAISVDNADENEAEEDVFAETENEEDVFSEPEVEQQVLNEMEETESEATSESTIEETESDLDIDPFAGLLDDASADSPENEMSEDENVDDITFENESKESDDTVVGEEPDADTNKNRSYDDVFDDLIFGEEEGDQPNEEAKPSPGPEKWGIDTYRDESDENMFSGLLGNKEASESAGEKEQDNDITRNEPSLNVQFDEDADTDLNKSDEVAETAAPALTEDDEDFDDPFRDFEDSDEDERQQQHQEEDIIPVITNISSGTGEKEEPGNTGLKPKTRSSRERKNSPVFLWILLLLIICGGVTYALGYFGIVKIPGIDAKIASTSTPPAQNQVPPVVQQDDETPENRETEPTQEAQSPTSESNVEQSEEPVTNAEELATDNTTESPEEQVRSNTVSDDMLEAPAGQPRYGMMGIPVKEASNGYTIVIYSLSILESAEKQKQLLLDRGFRALVYSLPHAQYGTIYRVSLGQFESLRDAALAAENLKPPYSESYFITNIQPTN